ncbi:putative pectinesterase/pectinesterase inhibitor 22 [Sorghum bicolor]|uniref:Pectinesterase n=1 Tax=Sorghum bicolor TaxID=4558 RepID=A0A194YGT0_SORBI|nr:putative pectinesterase/pectinesterase inhibitor 22 [Sorghum bicolor]KXG19177.1 hypothetical protein SORBI_3010G017600 [Sorghum bicolor]|eukprot:XP_021306160.1 putative pectinesterase/pectinesterase inhibitor 22 [Sorghum bicolor]
MVVSNHEAGGRLVLVVVGLMLMTSAATTTDGDAAAAAAAAGGAPLRLSAGSTTNAQVAQDGRPGSYPTISQALEHAPTHEYEHVVFIGKGTYPETLTITRPNVRLVGEGIGRTIITGNRCKRTGYDTASSATVSVLGQGFMARDLTIENTAGVDAGQAVALRMSSDKSVCYRCELRGFQDTLWADAGDQFYRSCIITGTVDFIFGNARA